MAEQQKSRFEYDDWVGAVRPDPRNTDKLTLLQGYIGQSSEAGHIRVYSDDSLNSFVEVPEDAIIYAQKLSAAESSLGGSKLWVRSDSVITYGDPKLANRPKSTFLEGDIMQQYAAFGQPDTTMMAGTAGQPDTTGPIAQAAASTPFVLCNVTKASVCQICPTLQVSCFQTACNIASCNKTICQYVSCHQTICNLQTCQKTICGPKSCIPIICNGGGGGSIIACPSIACGTGGFGGPVVNPGFSPMGGQPDTTPMGGYYGMFNPYM